MKYTIKSESNSVSIESLGAQLSSINIGGTEYLWQGDEKYWPRRAPNLFPHCGRVMNDEMLIDGVAYKSGRHGFARDFEHTVIAQSTNSVTFELKHTDKTFAKYPYKFSMQTTYTLNGAKLQYNINIINLDNKDISFSVGTHVGISLNQMDNFKASDYELKLEKAENPTIIETLASGFITEKTSTCATENGVIAFDGNIFAKTLIMQNIKSEHIDIVNKTTRKNVRFDFGKKRALVLWCNEGEPQFICVEPWDGLPDYDNKTTEFKNKVGNITLAKGETYAHNLTISII